MKQSFLVLGLFTLGLSQTSFAQHGASGAQSSARYSQNKARLLSEKDSNKLTCLDFGSESDYELEVVFKNELKTQMKANEDKAYILNQNSVVESNRKNKNLKVGSHCELYVSSFKNQESAIKANTPYKVESAPGRLSGFKDAAGQIQRGCRLNLNKVDPNNPAITSLQCFVNGTGEASIADLRKAFANHGEILVRKK